MKKIICVFLSMILVLSSCSQSVSAWQEQYDLGMRYLSEGNYEEAIIAFTAAIEIDPKRADAYLQLAEVYMRTNETENAIRVINQGIDACGESDDFTELLDQIQSSDTPQTDVDGNDIQHTDPTGTSTAGQEQSAPPVIDFEHLVTDAYRKTISVYEYVVPTIALAGHDTSQINSEIWDDVYVNVISEQLESIQQGCSVYCYGTAYDWAVNENILSLWVSASYGPTTSYYVYNIDVLTGEKLSNNALLKAYGITVDNYNELVRQALYSYNYDDFTIWASNDMLDREETVRAINWALSESISDENVERALPFLNHGDLCIAGIVFQIAGADANEHIINLEEFEANPNYPALFDLPTKQQKLLSEDEALKIAEEKSGYYDGQFEGDDYVIQIWRIGEQTYNARQMYAFQVRRLLRIIEGPQLTMLIETIYVDVETGQCFWEAMGTSGAF